MALPTLPHRQVFRSRRNSDRVERPMIVFRFADVQDLSNGCSTSQAGRRAYLGRLNCREQRR
jgi:hypothetical protein